jgi:hypothetical protein
MTAPGVYNLNRIRVSVQTVGVGEATLQYLPAAHLVAVSSAGSA